MTFLTRKAEKHIFEILSMYSFDGYLAGFYTYPVATPNIDIFGVFADTENSKMGFNTQKARFASLLCINFLQLAQF